MDNDSKSKINAMWRIPHLNREVIRHRFRLFTSYLPLRVV